MALHNHFTPGKVLLFTGSAVASLIVASIVGGTASSFVVGLATLIIVFPAYVYVGAHAIRTAEDVMKWGFPGESEWTTEQRLMYGAFWPFVLAFWAVVASFNRIVSDLYK
jgi:hypothetical protein